MMSLIPGQYTLQTHFNSMRLIPEYLSGFRGKPLKGRLVRPKPLRKPVTLIIGIICEDGIVMASDSQTTWGTGKSWDANKMTELRHPYGRALVAESGAVLTSQSVVGHLIELAKDEKLFDEFGLPGLAAKAVKKVRDQLRHQQFDCSSEEFRDYTDQQGMECALMIAHYEGRTPRIHTISFNQGMAQKAPSYFEAVGSGSDLATHILGDLCSPGEDSKVASVIGVHVVETVKRHDPYCGGPTKLGILRVPINEAEALMPPEHIRAILGIFSPYETQPLILSDSEVSELVQMVSEVDAQTKKIRATIIRDALKKRTEQRMSEMMDE